MPNRRLFVKHNFVGGWATSFGPGAPEAQMDLQTGVMNIPYLLEANNVIYKLTNDADGIGFEKADGLTKVNSSALESGAIIRGVFDTWFQGTAGTPTQHRVVYVNGKIYKDDGDGSFSSIKTGLTVASVPHFNMFDDFLIIGLNNTTDVPMSWDGTTFQNLAGSPPNFSFSVSHGSYVFASGVAANPSNIYYCETENPEDWSGLGGTVGIKVSPNDGDRVTGIVSHLNELLIFKGPYKGSIHRLAGKNVDQFLLENPGPSFHGIGSVNQNSIVQFGNDMVWWWSDGTCRRLTTTAAFGDLRDAAVSFPIQSWLDDNLNFAQLHRIQGALDETGRRIYYAVPTGSSAVPDVVLCLDLRFDPPRWSKVGAYNGVSVGEGFNSNVRTVLFGGSDGFVRRKNKSVVNIDGTTGIGFEVVTPYINYGFPYQMKELNYVWLGVNVKNSGTINFDWLRDSNTGQTTTLTQTSPGVELDTFTLDTDVLGIGEAYQDIFSYLGETGGEFRNIRYTIRNANSSQDLDVRNFGASIELNAEDTV